MDILNEKWIFRFMDIANRIALWSKDPSKKIGALIVDDKGTIVSQGYNGFPAGIHDSDERLNNRELKYKYVIHAEVNAILNASKNGAKVGGCYLFVSGLPVCSECAKLVIQSGIKKVYYNSLPSQKWQESCEFALEMFKEAGVETQYIDERI